MLYEVITKPCHLFLGAERNPQMRGHRWEQTADEETARFERVDDRRNRFAHLDHHEVGLRRNRFQPLASEPSNEGVANALVALSQLLRRGRITSYNVCYTKLLRNRARPWLKKYFFTFFGNSCPNSQFLP